MLMVVVMVFFVCWAPYTIYENLAYSGLINSENMGGVRSKTRVWLHGSLAILAYSNSCANPIVYFFMYK